MLFEKIALSLHKICRTSQSESKLSLHSIAKSLHRKIKENGTKTKKKRIAIILLTFTAIVGWTTHSCVSRCTSASDKNKAADSLPKAHINDSISNALTEGKEYHEMDSVVEGTSRRWEINGAQLVITRNDSLLYARGFGMG